MDQILLDSLAIDWCVRPGEPDRFREMWNDGEHILKIAEELRRKPLEIALMALEQGEQGLIKNRSNGIFGGELNA
ncbi:hypothetical protein SporoP37_15750 [Sporosarcina sp. P37]|uniref:hypothetical protein n=1 Tax=unclassified Sporosarcina TaxID=2647733 RepID=UPI000A17C45B|nr:MULTISPECIES: hypothetical protein [unclassified Sporosarcina]ARK25980.1 hypothetical protein SporoP37_15750 [Sporosarcina sp. P37]PID19350.1 hypothetical protein CSV62_02270 [Sporosarcina sp. P35]